MTGWSSITRLFALFENLAFLKVRRLWPRAPPQGSDSRLRSRSCSEVSDLAQQAVDSKMFTLARPVAQICRRMCRRPLTFLAALRYLWSYAPRDWV
jgi:hypothetical protein